MNEQIKIGSIIKQIRGVSYKPTDVREADEKNAVALLRANNIQETGLNFDELVYIDRSMVKSEQYLRAGDILICSSSGSKNLVGKAAYVPEDLPCSFGAFCKVVRTQAVDSYYLGQYFQSPRYRQEISEASAGANINNIRNEHIDELTIPAHSKSEQMEIVQILLCLNKQIDCTKQHLEKLDELVKSRFIELFGDPVANSFGWKQALLCEVTSKIGSGATPRGGKESYQAEGITLIRSMNVHDGRFEYKDLAHITDEQAAQLDNVTVEDGDVFINITGASVARSCIVPTDILPARVNQHVAIIRCVREWLHPRFANNMFLNDRFKGQLLDIGESGGATRQAITKQQLENLAVILPPLELQEQFAAFVEQTDKSKLAIQESLVELETLKKALMQKYFG